MYITTFYSFKGGVGRTMALVNVAVELVRMGRRVLAVDFDLEAPGLDTFDLSEASGSALGMIDFVCDYLQTGQAPDVSKYLTRSTGIGIEEGGLWIMPAGAQQHSYANKFAGINWGELYDRYDGYLLFEDLKLQWKEHINPDYVLIDSRTGHTDIGGICTRQMPNAVVILFFPNTQNLRGLTKVVRDIRAEENAPRNKQIDLHFVMSNVPDLDDEDDILSKSLNSFRRNLQFIDDPLIVHRYDSLSLLNQVIFTKDRPKSRLAKEYRQLGREIMRNNPSDRDGALDYLEEIDEIPGVRMNSSARMPSHARIEAHVSQIEKNHKRDGEVLFRLGLFRARYGSFEDSVTLFSRAIEGEYRNPEIYLHRATLRRRELNDKRGAIEDLLEIFNFTDVPFRYISRALAWLPSEELHAITDSRAIASMTFGDRTMIASKLDRNKNQAEVAVSIVSPLLRKSEMPHDDKEHASHVLTLALIASGEFSAATKVVLDLEPDIGKMKIEFAFNYGMAHWGQCNEVNETAFERVLQLDQQQSMPNPTPNRLQCLAVSYWATHDTIRAREFAERARLAMEQHAGQEFSCWRYLRVSMEAFNHDVEELVKMIDGDKAIKPRFMSASEHQCGTSHRQ